MGKKQEPGHKCERVQVWVEVVCECGWRSTMAGGPGARSTAYAEWRAHRNWAHGVRTIQEAGDDKSWSF